MMNDKSIIKKILILSFLVFLAISYAASKSTQPETTIAPAITIKKEFIGIWRSEYIFNPEDLTEDWENSSFELRLEKDDTKENALKGWHCSVVRGGRKIDCVDNDEEPSIYGYVKNDTAYIHFASAWEVEGKAKLYFNNSAQDQPVLIWDLCKVERIRYDEEYEVKGIEHYMPQTDTLLKVINMPDESMETYKKGVDIIL